MDETNLIKKVREERVPGYMKRGKPKKFLPPHPMIFWPSSLHISWNSFFPYFFN